MVYRNTKLDVNLTVAGFGVKGTWEPNEDQYRAAWELYVELSTRVAVIELKESEGLLRETLSSLHALFAVSREIMKKYGPDIAVSGSSELSLGFLTVNILNEVIRPFLSKWHPLLSDYEDKREVTVSRLEHEQNWEKNKEFREHLDFTSKVLYEYSKLLAKVAGVPNLLEKV